jgi:hypothetical protein
MLARNSATERSLTVALVCACVAVMAACGVEATRPPSSPGVGATVEAVELVRAIEFRRAFGLRADAGWATQIALDPLADHDFGVPLARDEAALVHRRLAAAKTALIAVDDYARGFPEYGGGYIDLNRGGLAVVQFTGRLDEHRKALTELVGSDAQLEIRQVSWTFEELVALKERVGQEAGWMRSVAAELVSVGVKPSLNMVHVKISSANPGAGEAIIDHFDARGALYVESDGAGVRLMPTGTLVLRAVDSAGRPVADLLVNCGGDLPDTGTGDIGTATDASGMWQAELTATGYECDLRAGERVVGSGRVVIPPGGTAQMEIVIPRR